MAFEIKNHREEAILYFALAAKRDEYALEEMHEAAKEADEMIMRLVMANIVPKEAPKPAPFRLACKNKLVEEIGY